MSANSSADAKTAVGDALRGHRKANGLKIADLAERLKVSTALISKVETGKLNPSEKLLRGYATLAGLGFEELEQQLDATTATILSRTTFRRRSLINRILGVEARPEKTEVSPTLGWGTKTAFHDRDEIALGLIAYLTYAAASSDVGQGTRVMVSDFDFHPKHKNAVIDRLGQLLDRGCSLVRALSPREESDYVLSAIAEEEELLGRRGPFSMVVAPTKHHVAATVGELGLFIALPTPSGRVAVFMDGDDLERRAALGSYTRSFYEGRPVILSGLTVKTASGLEDPVTDFAETPPLKWEKLALDVERKGGTLYSLRAEMGIHTQPIEGFMSAIGDSFTQVQAGALRDTRRERIDNFRSRLDRATYREIASFHSTKLAVRAAARTGGNEASQTRRHLEIVSNLLKNRQNYELLFLNGSRRIGRALELRVGSEDSDLLIVGFDNASGYVGRVHIDNQEIHAAFEDYLEELWLENATRETRDESLAHIEGMMKELEESP